MKSSSAESQHVRLARRGLDQGYHQGPSHGPPNSAPARSGSIATMSSTPRGRLAVSKDSGIGRELGEYALRNYTEIKTSLWRCERFAAQRGVLRTRATVVGVGVPPASLPPQRSLFLGAQVSGHAGTTLRCPR